MHCFSICEEVTFLINYLFSYFKCLSQNITNKNISHSFGDCYYVLNFFPCRILFEVNSHPGMEAGLWQGPLWFCPAPCWIVLLDQPHPPVLPSAPRRLSSSPLFPPPRASLQPSSHHTEEPLFLCLFPQWQGRVFHPSLRPTQVW